MHSMEPNQCFNLDDQAFSHPTVPLFNRLPHSSTRSCCPLLTLTPGFKRSPGLSLALSDSRHVWRTEAAKRAWLRPVG